MNLPEDLQYTSSHEWVRYADGVATVGITEHAQNELSDVVFVELPEVGAGVKAGQAVCVVESVKAASDIYAPVSGAVESVNETLRNDPGLLNKAPYESGWIFKIRMSATFCAEDFKSADAYREMLQGKH